MNSQNPDREGDSQSKIQNPKWYNEQIESKSPLSQVSIMKKLIWILPLSLLSLTFAAPSNAKDIAIRFAEGSSCSFYQGPVKVGDNFVLNLAKEQQLVIKTNSHDYSVIAPNGKTLPVIGQFPDNEKQYWTGNQSGKFKINVKSVPQELQINIQLCAYSGEGKL